MINYLKSTKNTPANNLKNIPSQDLNNSPTHQLKNSPTHDLKNILQNELPKEQTKRILREDEYINEVDKLIYCKKCNTAKQRRFDKPLFTGLDVISIPCDCRSKEIEERHKQESLREHLQVVEQLRIRGIQDKKILEWTFENADTTSTSVEIAKKYVENFEKMKNENIGLLLWGNIGTGKSYLAGCIANALINKEISVRMTNFAVILGDMTNIKTDKTEYIKELNNCQLLILDDFGMERDTAFALEQVYNVIDSRYTTSKPLIITTNLMFDEMKNTSVSTDYRRIYDRILEMCIPIRFDGASRRKNKAEEKLHILREILG